MVVSFVGWQGALFLVVTTILVRRLSLASVVRFPDRHDRNRSCGWFRLPADPLVGWPLYWFCGGHGPGETPGPFPNPEAKAWHGDGTAPDRVWESSTPPHHTYRKPLGAHAPRGFRIPETLTTQTHTPPQKHPGASRTHETHVRDHSRPAPPSGPKRDGAARSHFRRKSGKQHVRDRGIPTPGPPPPRSAVRTPPP